MSDKVVFVHDHVFKRGGKDIYSSASLSYENMKAYRCLGKLSIIGRGRQLGPQDKNLALSSGPGVEHTLLPDIKSLRGLTRIPSVLKRIEWAIKDASLVIVRLPSAFGLLAYYLAKRNSTTVLVEVVGNARESLTSHGSKWGGLASVPVHKMTQWAVRSAENVTYITKNYLQSIYPAKHDARQYVCSNALLEIAPKEVFSDRLARDLKGEVNIGLIGSLDVSYKGHDTAIRALKILNEDSDIIWRLNFVGGGSADRWVNLASALGVKSHVRFIGAIKSGHDIFSFIDRMDIMFQPSLVEGQGRSIIEAMSRACPVVATKTGGIVELYNNDFMVKPSSPDALANIAKKIVFEKEFKSALIEEQFQASRCFSRAHLENKKMEIIKRCVA